MINKPKNPNYCATVVEIKTLIPLDNCDNVQGAIIFGNQIIVGNDTKIGDVGLYFPVETQLSSEFCSSNNLYRKAELNVDPEKKGYIEENRRIRCVKFRGNKSEGFFIPLNSLDYIFSYSEGDLKVGDEFDELFGHEICTKYIVKSKSKGQYMSQGKSSKKYESKLIDNQFKFHIDTSQLAKNLSNIKPEDWIQCTYKIHGTSLISSYILCKKNLKWYEKILKKLGVNIIDTEYDYIYSSRKVIKNDNLNKNAQHFYNENIWEIAHKELEPFLKKGMTIYAEIAGFLPDGGYIQKQYDYGCESGKHKVFIYRITQTNVDGQVLEYSPKQVQEFCRLNHLTPVPELFYGQAKEFSDEKMTRENWENLFLETLQKKYTDKDCYICKNQVPEEGVVIRKDKLDLEVYKLKSSRFFEFETKELDKGEVNIEEEN